MAGPGLNNLMQDQLVQAAAVVEQQVDAEIEKMNKMEEDDFDVLRQKRMHALKKSQQQKQEWMSMGHGRYEEICDEKEFFNVCKKSKNVVCHFYRDSTFRCKVIDKHLEILAAKHVETRVIKMNAEKCPFLVERLRVVVLPTICLAKNGKTVDYVVGFDDLGGRDDFPTEILEWRIARADVINYSGDILTPPDVQNAQQKKKSLLGYRDTKTIRDEGDDDSEGEDW